MVSVTGASSRPWGEFISAYHNDQSYGAGRWQTQSMNVCQFSGTTSPTKSVYLTVFVPAVWFNYRTLDKTTNQKEQRKLTRLLFGCDWTVCSQPFNVLRNSVNAIYTEKTCIGSDIARKRVGSSIIHSFILII